MNVSEMVVSISISVQCNTIHVTYIKSPYTHQHSSSFQSNYIFTKVLFWLYLLIVLSGDVEINPGPESVDLFSSCSPCRTVINLLFVFEYNYSVVHWNVHNLLAKVDQMELPQFDVIVE